MECIKAGATDYVLKDQMARLPEAVRRALREWEMKRLQKALSDSRAQFQGIVESAMDAIICVDEEQRIILFNPAAQRMFRCPLKEALDLPINHFIPERFRFAHSAHIRRFGETGIANRRMGQAEFQALRHDGEEFTMESSISVSVVDDAQQFTVILRDISERKRSELELAKKNEDLARSQHRS